MSFSWHHRRLNLSSAGLIIDFIKMAIKHSSFIARTVLCKGSPDQALKVLDGILSREGLFTLFRRTRRYEKPTLMRRRINYERCQALINEDTTRKVKFLFRKNRTDPFPAS